LSDEDEGIKEALRRDAEIEAERGVERQQHLHGQRPLIILQLVEIAQRNAEPLRQSSLGQALLFA